MAAGLPTLALADAELFWGNHRLEMLSWRLTGGDR